MRTIATPGRIALIVLPLIVFAGGALLHRKATGQFMPMSSG